MAEEQSAAERINMACFELSRQVGGLACSVPEAAPLARTLLRVVGRVVIDTGVPGAEAAVWENTEVMALQWIREALEPLGYDVRPRPDSGRPEVPDASSEWV
ncbi:MAG: hypothetical protein E6J41_16085 [Chloroflexi bacterium]|nr:MAG: hypothetical protein E6J41_16085 [Chloroflexota bacterium]